MLQSLSIIDLLCVSKLLVQNAVIILCFVILSRTIHNYWANRRFYQLAAKIPGRRAWPIIGNGLEFITDLSDIMNVLTNLVSDFGGTAKTWIGPHLLVIISHPEDLDIYYNHPKLMDKNFMYTFFEVSLGNGLLTANGELWKSHRKLLSPAFHPTVLKTFLPIFERHSKILVKGLKNYTTNGEVFDIFPHIRDNTLTLILETAIEMTSSDQKDIIESSDLLMTQVTERMFRFWMHPGFIYKWTKSYKRERECMNRCIEIVQDKLDKLRNPYVSQERGKPVLREKKTFSHILSELCISGSYTEKDAFDEMATIVSTGYETSAATVSFIMMMLGIHQHVQDRMYEEMKEIQGILNGKSIEADDLKNFVYTEMVIKETLRLFPVGPITFRKCQEDVKIGEYIIPKGASIAAYIYSTHRDPKIWENPDEFNPDNFLDENVAKRHYLSFVPFAAGPRTCIGKTYAFYSMKVMLYYLLLKFQVFCDLKMEDIKPSLKTTLKSRDGFNIRLKLRHTSKS